MPPPRISVIMPARNVEPYIGDAIESALRQTFPPHEIVVVDDGSTDGTGDVARRFGPPVIVISQRVNGSGPGRNLAVSRSSGDWLGFLDADDLWLPEKLARQVEQIGPDTRLICTDRFNMGELRGMPYVHGALQPQLSGDVFVPLLLANFIVTSSVLLRRDAFDEAGGFPVDADLIVAQDWDLWMRIVERYPIVGITEPLVKYRLHMGGASRQVERMLVARERVVSRAFARSRGQALPGAVKRRIRAATHMANGFDAGRAGRTTLALRSYLQSLAATPWQREAWLGLARVALRRI